MLIGEDHVPLMPLEEVVGSAGIDAPIQYGPTDEKVGATLGVITMVNDVDTAHCPALGVKVYCVVVVLLMGEDQVPLMPLLEVVGRAGMEAPLQYGPTAEKVGVVLGVMVTVKVVDTAHCPWLGVNV